MTPPVAEETTPPEESIFGDGSDGEIVVPSVADLTRDEFFESLASEEDGGCFAVNRLHVVGDTEPTLDELGARIEDGLHGALVSLDGLAIDLGLAPLPTLTEGPPPTHLGEWLEVGLKQMVRDAEHASRHMENLLRRLDPTGEFTAQREEEKLAKAAEKAARPPKEHGRRGKEVRGDDGITHRLLTERQRELVRTLTVDAAERVSAPPDHLTDWEALKIVVETLGGMWRSGGGRGEKKRAGYWVFPEEVDPREALRIAAETGKILDPKSNDLYETADWLADRVVELADIRPGMVVLEPNAGRGRLALAVRRACPEAEIVCVELLEENAVELRKLGFKVLRQSFLDLTLDQARIYDRIVMNPPFSKLADAKHIRHALGFMRSGSRIVAIGSSGLRWRTTAAVTDLREILSAWDATWEDVPAGAFSSEGTEISTTIVAATADWKFQGGPP